jgi:hypothetical protein
MSRELKILALFAAGLLAARFLVVAVDAIAESIERRPLYR